MAFPRVTGFEILSLLGEGGMGAVYRAREAATGREVALKILQPPYARDEEFVLRFKREARALESVEHPGIARFYGSGADEGLLYFAMELVDGEPLAARLEDGPLPVVEACRTVRDVARALAGAHEVGIIHRDVKPSNVILSRDGAKLTDFGLARPVEGTALTTSGRVMGSLAYMPPEQVSGKGLGPASDIYSLGVVLYEALTGRVPFEAADEAALAAKILAEPAAIPSRERKDVPAGLNVLVVRMLAKDPALRPQSAAEVAERLEGFLRKDAGAAAGRGEEAGGPVAGDRALSTAIALLIRAVPAANAGDGLVKWLKGMALGAAIGAAGAARIEAAALRREMRRMRREIKAAEKKRDARLRRAEGISNLASRASAEEAQALRRDARELGIEAEVFDARARTLADRLVQAAARVRHADERARLAD